MEEKIAKIKRATVRVVQTYFSEDIPDLLQEIETLKKDQKIQSGSALLDELNIYRALLLFVDFPSLAENEQLRLFREDLLKALRVGIDVRERFFIKMNTLDASLWPETVQKFIEALMANEEKIGKSNILVEGETDQILPCLKNWLRDYNRIYGMDKHDRMMIHKYLTENRNVSKLNQEETMLLLKALELYESLKFPTQSQFMKAFEEYLNRPDSDIVEVEELLGISGESQEDLEPIKALRQEVKLNAEDVVSDSIKELIRKFPRVIDQEITGQPIKLIYNGKTVRPTIENWLSDYSSFAGAEGREVNDRSNYLLRSPNAVNLKLEERVRLGLLLRSFDEGYLLPFSTTENRVIFNQLR